MTNKNNELESLLEKMYLKWISVGDLNLATWDNVIKPFIVKAYQAGDKNGQSSAKAEVREMCEGMKRNDTDPLHSYMPSVYNQVLSDVIKRLSNEGEETINQLQ